MHPELIKAHLRIGGVTPAAIADELRVSPVTVSGVIHGRTKSRAIAERIAAAIGRPLAEVWPQHYGPASGQPLHRRRAAA